MKTKPYNQHELKQLLKDYIVKLFGSEVPGIENVIQCFKPKEISKGECINQIGQPINEVFFLIKGCMNVYTLDDGLTENTREILIENSWYTDLFSFMNNTNSAEHIKAIEDCLIVSIQKEDFLNLMDTIPHFSIAFNRVVLDINNESVRRINMFVSMDAKERMKWLYENKRHLLNRVPAKILASYIGLTKETFSRMRKQMIE